MEMKGKPWSREELILSLNLYFKLEYSKIQSKTPEIIALALVTGRSPDSITMRLTNFISCDLQLKERGIKGLDGGLAQCQPIWDEFYQKTDLLTLESERILSNMKTANLSCTNQKNIVNVIDQEVIWKRIVSLLSSKNNINYFGSNPYYIVIDSSAYFVFIRNLTRAYPYRSPDVCRIQLHKNTKFEKVKGSNVPLITLGYCEQFDTIAYWSSEKVKPRLNGRGNVSLYSRFSAQIPPEKGKYKGIVLNNGELVNILNFEDIGILFSELATNSSYPIIQEGLFANENISEKAPKKIHLAISSSKELYSLVKPYLYDTSELKAIQICISYCEEHNLEYNLITIKNIIAKFKTKSLHAF